MLSKVVVFSGISAIVIGLTGCFGYQLGTSLPPNITSVYVRPFDNRSGEPDVETAVTSATVREFQKDGSLRMANAEEADVIVEASVTRVTLEPLRYSKDRATETTEFRLLITANVALKDRKTGKVLSTHPGLTGKNTFVPAGDLSSAKRLAIPTAAQDLAHRVVAAVVEAW
ncbi:MAG: LptE family protein [bacterium]